MRVSAEPRRSKKPRAGRGRAARKIWIGKDVQLVKGFGCRYRVTRWGFRVLGRPVWLVRREERLSC